MRKTTQPAAVTSITAAEFRKRNNSQTQLQKMQALGRLPSGQMNKTEIAYSKVLDERKYHGEIVRYWFEGIKFRLADKTYYTPDFMVQLPNGAIEIHEVKGFFTDDARVKVKTVAEMFPFPLFICKMVGKKWEITEI